MQMLLLKRHCWHVVLGRLQWQDEQLPSHKWTLLFLIICVKTQGSILFEENSNANFIIQDFIFLSPWFFKWFFYQVWWASFKTINLHYKCRKISMECSWCWGVEYFILSWCFWEPEMQPDDVWIHQWLSPVSTLPSVPPVWELFQDKLL